MSLFCLICHLFSFLLAQWVNLNQILGLVTTDNKIRQCHIFTNYYDWKIFYLLTFVAIDWVLRLLLRAISTQFSSFTIVKSALMCLWLRITVAYNCSQLAWSDHSYTSYLIMCYAHLVELLSAAKMDAQLLQMESGVELALDRAKAWSKYAKDVIGYIEKRTQLGKGYARTCCVLLCDCACQLG